MDTLQITRGLVNSHGFKTWGCLGQLIETGQIESNKLHVDMNKPVSVNLSCILTYTNVTIASGYSAVQWVNHTPWYRKGWARNRREHPWVLASLKACPPPMPKVASLSLVRDCACIHNTGYTNQDLILPLLANTFLIPLTSPSQSPKKAFFQSSPFLPHE